MGKQGERKDKKPKDRLDPGTKERVIQDTQRALMNPQAPLIGIDKSKRLTQAAVFADDGYKLNVIQHLAQRGRDVRFPRTPDGVYDSLSEMLTFCNEYRVVPTIGVFALWNGCTMQRVWQIENNKDDERAEAVSFCKEVIRQFLEQSTIDASLNPLVFFNMMKSQYGLAENQQVTVVHDDNSREISEDEYRQRITLIQGQDGVYRAPDND